MLDNVGYIMNYHDIFGIFMYIPIHSFGSICDLCLVPVVRATASFGTSWMKQWWVWASTPCTAAWTHWSPNVLPAITWNLLIVPVAPSQQGFPRNSAEFEKRMQSVSWQRFLSNPLSLLLKHRPQYSNQKPCCNICFRKNYFNFD